MNIQENTTINAINKSKQSLMIHSSECNADETSNEKVILYKSDVLNFYYDKYYYRELLLLIQEELRHQLLSIDGMCSLNSEGVCSNPTTWIDAIRLLLNEKYGVRNGRR